MLSNYFVEKYNNFLLNQSEIKKQNLIFKSKPLALTFNITNACNLSCIMCGLKKTSEHLDFEKIKNFIEYYGKTAMLVQWIGGEPLMYPHFSELLDYANSFGLSQIIVTNGLFLKDDIAEKVIKYNLDIRISIDSFEGKTYNNIRKNANFDTLLKNIDNVNALRLKYNHKGHFGINFCVIKQNYKQVVDMIEFAHKYNFQAVDFINTKLEENSFLKINENEMEYVKKSILIAREKAEKYKIQCLDSFDDKSNIREIKTCYNPFYTLGLIVSGKTTICSCNNVLLENSCDNWNSRQMQEYRKNIYDGLLPTNDICKQCLLLSIRHDYHPKILAVVNDIKDKLNIRG